VAFDNSKQPSMVESKDGEEGNRLVQFIPSDGEIVEPVSLLLYNVFRNK
jgi:hypothetical protein